MIIIELLAAVLVVTILILFVFYWRSVWKLPTGYRPLTPTYDRLGRPIGLEENPGYEEEESVKEREANNVQGGSE